MTKISYENIQLKFSDSDAAGSSTGLSYHAKISLYYFVILRFLKLNLRRCLYGLGYQGHPSTRDNELYREFI